MDSGAYAALAGLGVVLVNQTANLIRERRKDKREDAKAAAMAQLLADHTKKQVQVVIGAIEQNTAITEQNGHKAERAYSEANNFNARAEMMQGEIAAGREENARLHQQIADLMRARI